MIFRDAMRPGAAAAALVAALVVLLACAPLAEGRSAANPSMNLNFSANGTITLTLPDGTAVGTTSGAPTVIPAGYYAVVVLGPGGCVQLPLFDLKGPGENIVDDMSGGEVTSETYQAYFAPNSTYTWRTDNVNPGTVYTFTTTSTVLGSPVHGTAAASGAGAPKPVSQDIVGSAVAGSAVAGSAVAPFRGTLTGTVSAGGRLGLVFDGKAVKTLKAGRYRLRVTDSSPSDGFMLGKTAHAAQTLTAARYVGTRSISITLTAGKWQIAPAPHGKPLSIVVSAIA
ncbi:MAG TPA: hypothetical protein VG265_15130 [Gaiellaceae bacterium]|nr:hypothetical protein [Gaiellaceae bacterium]